MVKIVPDNVARALPAHRRGRLYRDIDRNSPSTKPSSIQSASTCAGSVHTNTAEGVFSVFKRGMVGVYQHCSEKHLHRYLAEFDFRYNNRVALGVNDGERAEQALRGIVGKRLTYRTIG